VSQTVETNKFLCY